VELVRDELLTPQQVHDDYDIATQTLANYRWRGLGPAYVKGHGPNGRVRYRRSAIEKWLDAHTVRTAETA
jgi:hypothetical protein